jgi:hypothetical protein
MNQKVLDHYYSLWKRAAGASINESVAWSTEAAEAWQ